MKSGLFVSHTGLRCGVYQFGRRVFNALTTGENIHWQLLECDSPDEASPKVGSEKPDVIVLNYHPATLAWASSFDWRRTGAVVFSIFHEAHQEAADLAKSDYYDYLLCPDPTLIPRNPIIVPVPRVTIDRTAANALPPPPSIFTVGSFGFATPGKGFDRLCERVNAEFERARIRLNIPPHDKSTMIVEEYFNSILLSCRQAITKPGIELTITHDFFDDHQLMEFLSGNSLNAFLYDDQDGRGISSCMDYALASGRPMAVTRSSMSRHLHSVTPSICIEDCSLASIAERGAHELDRVRAAYEPKNAGMEWERAILKSIHQRDMSRSVPDGRGYNKILDDRSRASYTDALRLLHRHAPDMLARKIDRANIQQAFALDSALSLLPQLQNSHILAIGSFEDTAVATLKAMGHRVDEIDPNVNGIDLETFYCSSHANGAYNLILCVSVLEHVKDDELFMRMAADLLAPQGIAIFTVDFAETYAFGDRLPGADERFYTTQDILHRLMGTLPDCALLDEPTWTQGREDFEYESCHYGFASWVFRKLDTSVNAIPAWAKLIDEAHLRLEESKSKEIDSIKEIFKQIQSINHRTEIRLAGDKELIYNRLIYDYKAKDAPHELKLALRFARLLRKLSWKVNPRRKAKWLKKKADANLGRSAVPHSDDAMSALIPDYLDQALVTLSEREMTHRG